MSYFKNLAVRVCIGIHQNLFRMQYYVIDLNIAVADIGGIMSGGKKSIA